MKSEYVISILVLIGLFMYCTISISDCESKGGEYNLRAMECFKRESIIRCK
jgi:hypothetical protein